MFTQQTHVGARRTAAVRLITVMAFVTGFCNLVTLPGGGRADEGTNPGTALGQEPETTTALTVSEGYDLFQTVVGTQFGPGAVPADFFGPGSDPIDTIELEGTPLDPATGSADTIVERLADASLPVCPSSSDTIPIEIVALCLRNIAPLTVTFNGGQNPELWDLEVELAPTQNIGSMTIRCEHDRGGTFDTTLPITVDLTFTRQSDQQVAGPLQISDTLDMVGNSWVDGSNHFGTPVAPGSVVSSDCSGGSPITLNQGTTNFIAGVAPADPSGPGAPDECQIVKFGKEELQTFQNGRHNVRIPGFSQASCCEKAPCPSCSELTDDFDAAACIGDDIDNPRGDIIGGDGAECDMPGACCMPDNTCTPNSNKCCCELRGGTYLGDLVPCPDLLCERPPMCGPVACPTPCLPGCVCPTKPPPDPHATWSDGIPGLNQAEFGSPVNPPIPADFFGPGSDPFVGTVPLRGEALDQAAIGNVSTLVQRFGPQLLPEDPVGTDAEIPAEIIALSLVSTEPILVTFNGGDNPELWDMAVDLSDAPALGGHLTITKDHENGGTFESNFTIQPRFTFTLADDPGEVRVLDTGFEDILPVQLQATNMFWVHSVNPDLGLISPSDGTFVPGVEETVPGDPNSQQVVPATLGDPAAGVNHTVCPPTQGLSSPTLASPPHDILKNRYISIDPGGASGTNAGQDLDIRLTLTSTLVNGVTAIGSQWWANAPDADCIAVVGPSRPPVPPNWDDCPTLHLTGCPIIPTSSYDIVVIDGAAVSNPPLAAATQAKPGTKWHGDCVGNFTGPTGVPPNVWTAPNLTVNADDFVAAIKTFQDINALNATHLSVTDMEPNLSGTQINLLVNINDVFSIIQGFQGFEYPGPDIELCPD